MPNRHARSTRAAKHAVDLAVAAPQVIAHRTLRMAQATTPMTARDQQEFWTMGTEKLVAFNQSWFAMCLEAGRIQQRMAMATVQAFWFPWLKSMPRFDGGAWQRAAMDIAAKGLAPIRHSAVANARRLGRKD